MTSEQMAQFNAQVTIDKFNAWTDATKRTVLSRLTDAEFNSWCDHVLATANASKAQALRASIYAARR